MHHRTTTCAVILTTALATAGPVPADTPVTIGPQRQIVNGQADIPAGLFGVHAFALDEHALDTYGITCTREIHFKPGSRSKALDRQGQVRPLYRRLAVAIDCQGDRYAEPTILTNPDHADHFARIGAAYGQATAAAGHRAFAEFWNEPYLNWAERSHDGRGSVYHAKWYDLDKAVDGGPVTIKGRDQPLEHLRWKRTWARGVEDGKLYFGVPIPEGLAPGDRFTGRSPWYWTNTREQAFEVVEHWSVHDPSSPHWWSGKQNLSFYLSMFEPWARALKQANPDATILAGWDFGYHHGNWHVWRELIEPLLDRHIDLIDGITEHHYGIDPRAVVAWYEVGTAHTMSRHGKWIRHYNTECGAPRDPAVYGVNDLSDQPAIQQSLLRATYLLRDILGLIRHSPAKAGSRTAHHPSADGELLALTFLKHLRGPMLTADCADPDIWPVASLHDDHLVIVLFNDAADPRRIALTISPPPGTDLADGTVTRFTVGPRLTLTKTPIPAPAGAPVPLDLQPRQAIKLIFPARPATTDRPARPPATRHRTQHFATEGVLHQATADRPLPLSFRLPPAVLAEPHRATLRLVLENAEPGAITLNLAGRTWTPPVRPWLNDLPLPEGQPLEALTRLTVTVKPGHRPVRVAAASILLDHTP